MNLSDTEPLLMAVRLLIEQIEQAPQAALITAATIVRAQIDDDTLSDTKRRLCREIAKVLRAEAAR